MIGCETSDGLHVITTPNMQIIPSFAIESVEVHWQHDGLFGQHDPACWPQLLISTPDFYWLCAVRVRPPAGDHYAAMIWTTLQMDDMVPNAEPLPSGIQLYIVSNGFISRLEPLIHLQEQRAQVYRGYAPQSNFKVLDRLCAMMATSFRSLRHASTTRDLVRRVADVQRLWLFADAWIEFYAVLFNKRQDTPFEDPDKDRLRSGGVRADLMGCWTKDFKQAAFMFGARVPVWVVRTAQQISVDTVITEVAPTSAMKACQVISHGHFPSQAVYTGAPGVNHILAIVKASGAILDDPMTIRRQPQPSQEPLTADPTSRLGAARYHPCK